MKNKTMVSLFFLIFATGIYAQDVPTFFTHTDAFLKDNVQRGLVNYSAIKENPKALHALIDAAQEISVSKKDAATYQSFWINAYNLLVIKGIVANYPVKSPLDIKGFFDKTKHKIAGENITLNDIENKLLRANFPQEPRFHFVLVCAGLGCPPIINTAYTPEKLDGQLQTQTEKALNNPSFIQVNKNKVRISQLFEWYNEDFVQNGTVEDFINTYKTEPLPEKAKLSYYPYDWTLNEYK